MWFILIFALTFQGHANEDTGSESTFDDTHVDREPFRGESLTAPSPDCAVLQKQMIELKKKKQKLEALRLHKDCTTNVYYSKCSSSLLQLEEFKREIELRRKELKSLHCSEQKA